MLSAMVFGGLIFVLRVERNVIAITRQAHQVKRTLRALTDEILDADFISGDVIASRVVIQDKDLKTALQVAGTHIEVDHGGGARLAAFFVADSDGSLATVLDNVLVYDPDVAQPGDESILAKHVSQIGFQPILDYPDDTQPLRVKFRIGDPSADPSASTYGETGRGYQAAIVDTSLARRAGLD